MQEHRTIFFVMIGLRWLHLALFTYFMNPLYCQWDCGIYSLRRAGCPGEGGFVVAHARRSWPFVMSGAE